MAAQPTAQYTYGPANGGGDIIHFENSKNAIVSWIDSTGIGQGNLATSGAISAASALSDIVNTVSLPVGVETQMLVSTAVNIPAGSHKVLITASAFVNTSSGTTAVEYALRRGSGIGGALIIIQEVGAAAALAPANIMGVDTIVGPITGQQYTFSGVVVDGSNPAGAQQLSIAIFVI